MANLLKPAGINIIWSTTGTRTDPGEAKTNTGWVVELPPYQTGNWIEWKQDSAIAHINQHGVPEWDAVTEYQGNLSYAQGSDGIIYKCLVTNTNTDPINPLNSIYWVVAFETFGSVAVVQNALDAHLTNYATLAGIGNTGAARVNLSVWSRAEADARYAPAAGNASQTFLVGAATDPNHAVRLGQVAGLLNQATEATAGIAALATNAKAAAGTDDLTIMTPLKTFTVYLPKSGNLAGLANVATARSNLGLGSMAIESATGFLRTTNNLSDLTNTTAARANLGLTSTAIQPETYFNRVANNLADVANVSAARNNLGLTSTATTALSSFLLKADNLAGLGNVAAARANLGLTDIVTLPSNFYLTRFNNLSDLGNVQTARNNLGLGSAATCNVAGLTLANVLDFSALTAEIGYTRMPNGLTFQWGQQSLGGGSNTLRINFPTPFFFTCFNIQLTNYENFPNEGNTVRVTQKDVNGFTLSNGNGNTSTAYFWFAIGV